MKKILTILLFLIASIQVNATTYYYATPANGGNDSNNGLSTSTPFATIYKASTVLANGDVLQQHGSGTWTEANTCYFNNIKWYGIDTVNSVINLTSTAAYSIYFWTGDFNANPIEIRNIKFDGNLIANRGFYIWKKNDVYIHNCSFSNFITTALAFTNTTNPQIWATGLRFEDNVIYNSSLYTNMNSSAFSIIGQENYTIKRCNMSSYNRTGNTSGALIKLNYTRAGVIDSNELHVFGHNDGLGWQFAIESWNASGGDVITNNRIEGVVDLTGGPSSAYEYQTIIKHNDIGFLVPQSVHRHAIYIEGSSHDVLIDSNQITNVTMGIVIYTNAQHNSHDITISHNLITGIGSGVGNTYCYGIRQGGTTGYLMDNYDIYNNVIIGLTGSVAEVTSGIQLPLGGTVTDWNISNNVIMNFLHAPIRTTSSTGTIDRLSIQNNDFYQTGNANNPSFVGLIPTNVTNLNNLKVDPLFAGSRDFTLQSASQLIDAGLDVGYPYNYTAPDIGVYEYYIEFPAVPATMSINNPSNVTVDLIYLIGTVINDGGGTISARGICYATTPNPTTANNTFVASSGVGSFIQKIQGLKSSTVYYLRSYQINEAGTAYSSQIAVRTSYSSNARYRGTTYKSIHGQYLLVK